MSVPNPDGLISLQDFGRQFGVDEGTVRWWVKQGYIPYVMAGSQRMIRRKDAIKVVGGQNVGEGAANKVLGRGKEEGNGGDPLSSGHAEAKP